MAVRNDQCGTCIRKNRCMERSRLQACRGYIKKDPGSGNCGRSSNKKLYTLIIRREKENCKMAKTIKITSNNEISVVDLDFDDYRAIQKVVGGMFETVKTQRMFDYFGKPVMMLVDEEGILKQLPLNRTGSRFYGYPIVGDFILAVPTYEDIVAPDETDLIEWKERLIRDQNLKEVEA